MKAEITVAVISDFATNNEQLRVYLQDHAVDVTVEAEWTLEEDEQFDQHGGSLVRKYWTLRDWTIVEISLDGKTVTPDHMPQGFPMQEVLSIADGGALRDDLERIGPKGDVER
jgi:hypothetical protein